MRLSFRRSVATLIDQTVDSKAAQAQLGHASEGMTLEHYRLFIIWGVVATGSLQRGAESMRPRRAWGREAGTPAIRAWGLGWLIKISRMGSHKRH